MTDTSTLTPDQQAQLYPSPFNDGSTTQGSGVTGEGTGLINGGSSEVTGSTGQRAQPSQSTPTGNTLLESVPEGAKN